MLYLTLQKNCQELYLQLLIRLLDLCQAPLSGPHPLSEPNRIHASELDHQQRLFHSITLKQDQLNLAGFNTAAAGDTFTADLQLTGPYPTTDIQINSHSKANYKVVKDPITFLSLFLAPNKLKINEGTQLSGACYSFWHNIALELLSSETTSPYKCKKVWGRHSHTGSETVWIK